jgi:hypothetical protein
MTEQDIQYALGRHLFLQNIVIPNITMHGDGKGKGQYEADLIYFNLKARVVTEIEIKVSIQDFRADFKKKRYHDHLHVGYLYYAVPIDLYETHKDEIESLLGDAGLIVVNISNNKKEYSRYIKRAKRRKDVKVLNESEVINYLRIGCMKWVNR